MDLPDAIEYLVYSPDGQRLAASLNSNGIRVFDAGKGYPLGLSALSPKAPPFRGRKSTSSCRHEKNIAQWLWTSPIDLPLKGTGFQTSGSEHSRAGIVTSPGGLPFSDFNRNHGQLSREEAAKLRSAANLS
jgi:hypothetical protein